MTKYHPDFQPLGLAMGQIAGSVGQSVSQSDHFDHLFKPGAVEAVGEFCHVVERIRLPRRSDFEVLKNSQILKHGGNLKLSSYASARALMLPPVRDIFAVEDNAPGGQLLPPGNEIDRGGFAGPVRSEQATKFTRFDREVEMVDDVKGVV